MEIVRPVRGVELRPVRPIRRSIGLRDLRSETDFQHGVDTNGTTENAEQEGSRTTLHDNTPIDTLDGDRTKGPSDRTEVGEEPANEAQIEHINISRDRGHPNHGMTSSLLRYGLSLEQIAALSMRTS